MVVGFLGGIFSSFEYLMLFLGRWMSLSSWGVASGTLKIHRCEKKLYCVMSDGHESSTSSCVQS